MEIVIVVLMLGIIAAFAIPNFSASQENARERAAAHALNLIQEAMFSYHVVNDGYPPFNLNNVSLINDTLGTYIIEDNVTYSCVSSAASFTCAADSGSWDLQVQSDPYPSGSNNIMGPYCNGTDCPNCSNLAGGGCSYAYHPNP